ARVLVRFADTGDEQRRIVADGLRDALGASRTAHGTTTRLLELIGPVADELHARTETRGLAAVRQRPGAPAPSAAPGGWAAFDAERATYPAAQSTLAAVRTAADAIHTIKQRQSAREADADAVTAALADPAAASLLAAALDHVAASEPALVSILRDDV